MKEAVNDSYEKKNMALPLTHNNTLRSPACYFFKIRVLNALFYFSRRYAMINRNFAAAKEEVKNVNKYNFNFYVIFQVKFMFQPRDYSLASNSHVSF